MIGRTMVLAAGLALLAAPQAIAQDDEEDGAEMRQRAPRARMAQRASRAHSFDRMVGHLMDRRYELNLNDGQMSALSDLRDEARAVLAPMREEMRSIREGVDDGSLTREAAGDRLKTLQEQSSGSMEGLHNQLEEILEPEQRAMLRQDRARHGRGQARDGGRRGRRGRPGVRRR